MTQTSKTYSVMSGEPQLGKQRETTYTFDREDIMYELITLFEEDRIEDTGCEITLGQELVDIGTWLSQEDIDNINTQLDENCLDDDYGTDKVTSILADQLDKLVPDNAEVEFEGIEYV